MFDSDGLCMPGRQASASGQGTDDPRQVGLPDFFLNLIRSEELRGAALQLAFREHLASLQEPSTHVVEGLRLHAPGHGVYAPHAESSSQFIIRALKQDGRDLAGRRILDVGCGTGVLGLWAAARGATVVATDINGHAVEAAKRNAEENRLEHRFTVRRADLFEGVEGEFDIVLFNAPFFDDDTPDAVALADPGSRTIHRFLEDADKVLLPGGSIFVALSNFTDLRVLRDPPQWLWRLVALDWYARYRMARFLIEGKPRGAKAAQQGNNGQSNNGGT